MSKVDLAGSAQAKYRLAASAEMLSTKLPMRERTEKIASCGVEVGIWDWKEQDLADLAATGATFSSMTGYLRGDFTTEQGIADILETAQQSLEAAAELDCPRLNLHGTGLAPGGLPVRPQETVTPAAWVRAAETLSRLDRKSVV